MAFKLPTLPPVQPDWGQFQIWWQQVITAIETQENSQNDLLAQILAAQAAADAAAAAATAAQTEAAAVRTSDKISSSSTAPSLVLSASDAGASATITIAAHTRLYGDGTSLPVSGDAITGLAYSTLYAVYYDDPTTADTTPTYVATTVLKEAAYNYVVGRHYVDQITTPGAGSPPTSGGGSRPAGGGGPYP